MSHPVYGALELTVLLYKNSVFRGVGADFDLRLTCKHPLPYTEGVNRGKFNAFPYWLGSGWQRAAHFLLPAFFLMADEDDLLPSTRRATSGKTLRRISTGYVNPNTLEYEVEDIPIDEVPQPMPVFHDTPEVNIINDDLSIQHASLKNLNRMWKAVASVDEAIKLNRALGEALMTRRRLANKQLGAKEGSKEKDIYEIPD